MNEALRPEKRLGRGLSALLGDNKAKPITDNIVHVLPTSNNNPNAIELISLNKLIAGIYQPRQNFNHHELEELADSIKEHGVLQPILVRKADEDNHYEIIAGERRYRAAKLAGLTKIPAIIKKINNHEALELAIIENVQRSDLTLLEEAKGYKQLMEEFSYSQEQVSQKTGKSRSHIANILRLLSLPSSVHVYLERRLISMGHARAIINSHDPEALAHKIVESALTVREAEELARDEKFESLNNNPVLVHKETKVKFVNSAHVTDLENQLSEILESKVKINYNQFKNSGKITIEFHELEKVYEILGRLS